jgi:hypothetical protein
VLLTLALVICFTLLFQSWRRKLNRKGWAVIAIFAFSVSVILASVSVWSVWTPYTTNWNFHGGESDGIFPLSKLSYPLCLSVYHTPFIHLLYDGMHISGDVSFSFFLMNAKVTVINGTFSYPPVFGEVQLSYSIDFPLFNNGETFFIFLLSLFTIFNMIGALIGIALANILPKKRAVEF